MRYRVDVDYPSASSAVCNTNGAFPSNLFEEPQYVATGSRQECPDALNSDSGMGGGGADFDISSALPILFVGSIIFSVVVGLNAWRRRKAREAANSNQSMQVSAQAVSAATMATSQPMPMAASQPMPMAVAQPMPMATLQPAPMVAAQPMPGSHAQPGSMYPNVPTVYAAAVPMGAPVPMGHHNAV